MGAIAPGPGEETCSVSRSSDQDWSYPNRTRWVSTRGSKAPWVTTWARDASTTAETSSRGASCHCVGSALARMRGLLGSKRVHTASTRSNVRRAADRATSAAGVGCRTAIATSVAMARNDRSSRSTVRTVMTRRSSCRSLEPAREPGLESWLEREPVPRWWPVRAQTEPGTLGPAGAAGAQAAAPPAPQPRDRSGWCSAKDRLPTAWCRSVRPRSGGAPGPNVAARRVRAASAARAPRRPAPSRARPGAASVVQPWQRGRQPRSAVGSPPPKSPGRRDGRSSPSPWRSAPRRQG